jgi:hypothetical protein
MFFGLFKGASVEKKFNSGSEIQGDMKAEITEDLKVKVTASVEVDLIGEAKKLAEKTNTPIDDSAIAWLEKLVRAA